MIQIEKHDQIYMTLRDKKTAADRRLFIQEETGVNFSAVEQAQVDNEADVHCENMIGAVSLPLGVAGPLSYKGDVVTGEHYIPLATTEGALVASVSRGAKAVSLAGGANVFSYKAGTTRGPVFELKSLDEQRNLYLWIMSHKEELTKTAEATSSHLKLINMDIKGVANYLFIRISYDTDEAMGMNMVTIATQKIVEQIEKETGHACLSVAGNYDIDKKPAWLNFINNRGFVAWADVTLTSEILSSVLKTNAQRLFDVWLGKCMIGSAMSGSLGFNSHFANIIAAFFAATGQDIAHVGEGSMGIVTTKLVENGGLYVSIYLPDIMLGTVGGGTKLKAQTEARNITGAKTSLELAEVLAGAVLAGELSLLASLAEKSLARAHSELGR